MGSVASTSSSGFVSSWGTVGMVVSSGASVGTVVSSVASVGVVVYSGSTGSVGSDAWVETGSVASVGWVAVVSLLPTFVAAIACKGSPKTKTTASRSENNRLLIGFKCSFILPGNKISPRFFERWLWGSIQL